MKTFVPSFDPDKPALSRRAYRGLLCLLIGGEGLGHEAITFARRNPADAFADFHVPHLPGFHHAPDGRSADANRPAEHVGTFERRSYGQGRRFAVLVPL